MSLERLHEHRRVWQAKPVLGSIYGKWFDLLLSRVPSGGRVLEIGAGPGFLAEHARVQRPDLTWVATDLIPTDWNAVAADALQLPFARDSFDVVAGVDVVHHLAQPLPFFAEAARVLRPKGRVIMVEPWVSLLSYPVYRWFHEEGCRLGLDPAEPFAGAGGSAKDAFTGDAAVVFRLVKDIPASRWRDLGLAPPRVRRLNTFAYLLSLGFQKRSLMPRAALPVAFGLDRATQPLSVLLAMRVLAEWDRLVAA